MPAHFETEHKTIRYDPQNHILIATWIPIVTPDEYRKGMEVMLLAIGYYKTGKLVYDLTMVGGALHPDDIEWTSTNWHPRAIQAGHSHCALVIPLSNVPAQVSVEDVVTNVLNIIPTACFDNMEEAIEWIKQF